MKLLDLFIENIDKVLSGGQKDRSDLAKLLGISPQAVSNMLDRKNRPRLDTVEEIARVLGIPPFELLMTSEERDRWQVSAHMSAFSNAMETTQRALEEVTRRLNILESERAEAGDPAVPVINEQTSQMATMRRRLEKKSKKSG